MDSSYCGTPYSPVKKTTVQVEKSSDVKKSQAETDKFTAAKKVEARRILNKEKKKQLPAWMEKIEKQLGLMSLDEFANTWDVGNHTISFVAV